MMLFIMLPEVVLTLVAEDEIPQCNRTADYRAIGQHFPAFLLYRGTKSVTG